MELITWFVDFILHLDKHLIELIADYHYWVYAILFVIIFCETGVVVTPILPGDSLLFALGALAAVDTTGTLNAPALWALLMVAAWLGDATNFRIGRAIGPRAFSGTIPWLKKEYLDRTHAFYEKYGGKTIVLARFVPIVRTFAPFVAGVGDMNRAKFFTYNLLGGFLWVTIFIWGGYLFGNVPLIKENFGIVTIVIIVVSVMPVVWELIRGGHKPAGA
ncbi:membrane protein [Steroidobacter agaridevorans]|uniref:Membrane protein n=1 Tax=Steroidobacter agaridevorans TaxID=2695856 RepID=A0A829Y6Z6_9GAMM|nr:DedA family protein [Steroidobacter agaridevorans]GFE78556.1 membrane protein [Steroidobacter agaridevorans]GFE89511.1 membrane protein [Steroidobacter agaridevorans]